MTPSRSLGWVFLAFFIGAVSFSRAATPTRIPEECRLVVCNAAGTLVLANEPCPGSCELGVPCTLEQEIVLPIGDLWRCSCDGGPNEFCSGSLITGAPGKNGVACFSGTVYCTTPGDCEEVDIPKGSCNDACACDE